MMTWNFLFRFQTDFISLVCGMCLMLSRQLGNNSNAHSTGAMGTQVKQILRAIDVLFFVLMIGGWGGRGADRVTRLGSFLPDEL